MSYTFKPDQMYRMPTHFGPSTGPRRGPEGRTFLCKDNPKSTAIQVSFLFLSDPIYVESSPSLSSLLWFCIMREMLSKLPQFRGCQYNQSVIA